MGYYLFQNPPSLYIQGLEIIQLVTGLVLGFTECKDIMHLKYSKFNQGSPSAQVSSRTGMLMLYSPACLIASFFLFCKLDWPHASILLHKSGLLQLSIISQLHTEASIRLLVLTVAVALHFSKRVIEVLFIHRYSGGMAIDYVVLISFIYSFLAACLLYVMQISESLPSPSMNLMPLGILLFIVGMSGNLYHHYLLSRLRKDGAKGYRIPHEGYLNLWFVRITFSRLLILLGLPSSPRLPLVSAQLLQCPCICWAEAYQPENGM